MESIIGNKAKNLIKLESIGINVPDFICINDAECRNLDIEKLAKKIEKLSFPMIVRSSSEEEDLTDTSAAGKYYSIYNMREINELYKAIRFCWKNRGNLNAMGIIVQQQIIPRYSGVAFMQKQGDKSECVIEAIFGLGDMLVSGHATPKRIKANLDTSVWEVIREDDQRIAQIPRIDRTFHEPTDDIFYDDSRLRIVGINNSIIYGYMIYENNYWNKVNDAIEKLIIELKIIYEKFGDSDVEWVYGVDGKLSIVQRRPVTANFRLENLSKNGNGTCIVPGKIKGKLLKYEDYNGEQDAIVFAKFLNPKEFLNIITSRGLLTIENTLLSHTAILAREFNIPYYCGITYEKIQKYLGFNVEINFETGVIIESKNDKCVKVEEVQSDSLVKRDDYNILDEEWTKNYFLKK